MPRGRGACRRALLTPRCAGGAVVVDLAVAEGDQPVGVVGGVALMGDHHHGLAELVDGLAQQGQDLVRGRGVEVARGLVGEHHVRLRDQRSGDGHPLLLSARQLGRPMGAAVVQAHGADHLVEPLLVRLAPGDGERQHDVLLRREHRQQVEELEDEPEPVAAQLGEVGVVEGAEVGAGQHHRARGRAIEAGEDVHERRLARARRAHDRREAAAVERDADPVERVDGGVPLAVAASQVHRGHDRFARVHDLRKASTARTRR